MSIVNIDGMKFDQALMNRTAKWTSITITICISVQSYIFQRCLRRVSPMIVLGDPELCGLSLCENTIHVEFSERFDWARACQNTINQRLIELPNLYRYTI